LDRFAPARCFNRDLVLWNPEPCPEALRNSALFLQRHGSTIMELLTVAEFKGRYKISHSAFYREVAANRIPIRKIGRATRIALADAEKWAASLPTQTGEATNG
jgi:hypothetical protein